MTSSSYVPTGTTANFTLAYHPLPGTRLMVVNNTGLGFISGTFSNLTQGQNVPLTFGGITYNFVADYYGGNGNDLVLLWVGTRAVAWGPGLIGDGSNGATVPMVVSQAGILSGKTVKALAGGLGYTLALCTDGTLAAWGTNSSGQLGNGTTTDSSTPVAVTVSGTHLSGRTVVAIAAGSSHSLALCSDGTVAAWGNNTSGRLGDTTTTNRSSPVVVAMIGALSGKSVVGIAAGQGQSYARCSDGSLAAWGINGDGELGNGSFSSQTAATSTSIPGARSVSVIAAGNFNGWALCTDGTVYAWGRGFSGQLGNNSTSSSTTPVAVTLSGVLSGKTITTLSGGGSHCLALCSDGTIAGWGDNSYGQLGNGSTGQSSVPVLVTTSGVLAGKTPSVIAAGYEHSQALCTDGTDVAWGKGTSGQLGNGITNDSSVPVLVSSGGMSAADIFTHTYSGPMSQHGLALVTPNLVPTVASVSPNSGPTAGGTNVTITGTNFVGVTSVTFGGAAATNVNVTHPTTLTCTTPAGSIGPVSVRVTTASGFNAANSLFTYQAPPTLTSVSPNVGPTAGGTNVTLTGTNFAAPATVTFSGTAASNVTVVNSTTITCTTPARALGAASVLVTTPSGTNAANSLYTYGSSNADLSALAISVPPLSPIFSSGTLSYSASVSNTVTSITVTPTKAHVGASIQVRVNGGSLTTVNSGSASLALALNAGGNSVHVIVTAEDGTTVRQYSIAVQRASGPTLTSVTPNQGSTAGGTAVTIAGVGFTGTTSVTFNGAAATSVTVVNDTTVTATTPSGAAGPCTVVVNTTTGSSTPNTHYAYVNPPVNVTYTTGAEVPVTANGYVATNNVANMTLGFRPQPGATLMLVRNTSLGPIIGSFTNLAHGQNVELTFGVQTYKFVANYFGGTGNDIVLVSAVTRAVGWGEGGLGQLGTGANSSSSVPVSTLTSGVLSGKTVLSVAAGLDHSLAVCSDGSLVAWGSNASGQLGNGSTTSSSSPVAVTLTGTPLAGKVIVAAAAGSQFSVAMAYDGTLAAWGSNFAGRLGDGTTTDRSLPTAVVASGALAGKTVVAISAGYGHCLALCSDGTVVAWGGNGDGELGTGGFTNSSVPVAVSFTGALTGKTVASVNAGTYHSMVLCTDGTVAGWGRGSSGQFGNGSSSSSVPVALNMTGVLAGKTVSALSTGISHSLALCTDGTLAAWGDNFYSQIGDGTSTTRTSPVLVSSAGALAGKTVTGISAAASHSLAICSDSTVVAWGAGSAGQLGNGGTSSSSVPVAVSTSGLLGDRISRLGVGSQSQHSLALVGPSSAPIVTSISPSSGSVAGGTFVTITGQRFTGATSVTIGGAAATNFNVVSATSITCTTPAGTVGAADVAVNNVLGTGTGTGLFTYIAPPGVPTIGTATAGNANASVAFTAPASNGGSAITGYTATSSPGGLIGTGTTSPITVSGLTNGTPYTFTVTATNAFGTGAASAASNSVTPMAPNTAPSFTLPAGVSTPAGVTWTARASGSRFWRSITSSTDGSKLAAVVVNGQIYTSTDSGVNWTARENNRSWVSITSSADGSKLAAVVANGQIYTSTDSGVTWTARESNRNWFSIASSADGSKLAAVDKGGRIYTSTDSGATWTARESSRTWQSITSSADGSKLAAVVEGGQIYTSTDSGATWTARESTRDWYSIASSADGSKLAAGVFIGQIYTSTDSGVTWTARASSRIWSSITSSADGSKLAAGVDGGQIYTSTDGGVTWTARESNRDWYTIASSADGSKLAAGALNGQIYTSVSSSTPYNLSVGAGTGSQTIPTFATAISPGPVAEAGQTVSFTVTNDNNGMFTTQPAIASNGTLTFIPGNTPWVATVTVTAVDNGGTANGGVDTSAPQTFTITLLPAPEIALSGNSVNITNGDTTPNAADHTNFGSTLVSGGNVARTFTITNIGMGALTLTGTAPNYVSLSGAGATHFSVTTQPASSTVTPAGGTRPFVVTYDPSVAGTHTATVSIASNDADENPFTFAITGTGIPAPTVTLSTANLLTTATTLTITGTNFSTTPGENSVAFTPAGTGTVTASTATTLTVTSLSGHTLGALNAVVTTNGQNSGAAVQVATVVAPGPGDLDPLDPTLVGSYVLATAVQPDGKTIIAGNFSSVLGVPRSNIARLNADGTLDPGFDPKANSTVYSVAVQADGKVLLGGFFTSLQPNGAASATPRNRIARVNADGTLDPGFDPKANSIVYSVAVQADGKVLLGGAFTSLQPSGAASATPRNRIARVNADGTLDPGFDPNANSTVYSVAVQADGKVLLGGQFASLQPNGAASATRPNIARVNADGTLDPGFDPNANSIVYSVAVQADGKVLLGGQFTSLQPNGAASATPRQCIARLNADGTLDPGFDPNANNQVLSVAVQADGKVLLGGAFTSLQPNGAASATLRNRIARVNADGTLDPGFDPKANSTVMSVAVQADGKVLLGGQVTSLQPNGAASATPRNYFARLLNDPVTQTLVATSASQVDWTRGGSAPELSRTTLELSTDSGSTWTSLGAPTRVGSTANWRFTGLSLPASGQLRTRGVTSGGYLNGSSGLIEQVASFSGLPVPEIALSGNAIDILNGDNTPSGADHTHFGGADAASGTVVRTFTIANIGDGTLSLTGSPRVVVSGAHAADFVVTTQPAASLDPGGSTTFQISFDPSIFGLHTATVTIANNDSNETPSTFSITGTGYTTTEAAAATWASSYPDISGPDAAPLAEPFHDGIPNLLKYAFNMPLTGPNVAPIIPGTSSGGLPAMGVNNTSSAPTSVRIEFIRRKNSTLIYTPQYGDTLTTFVPTTATPVVTSLDATWERVVVDQPLAQDQAAAFCRVAVTAP